MIPDSSQENYQSFTSSVKQQLLDKNEKYDFQLMDAEFVRFKDEMLKKEMIKREAADRHRQIAL